MTRISDTLISPEIDQGVISLRTNGSERIRIDGHGGVYDSSGSSLKSWGVQGRNYAVVAGVIRNAGSPDYWQTLETQGHRSTNIDSVSTGTTTITVNYASVSATKVVSFMVVPDETLAQAGFFCGASVAGTSATINLERTRQICAQVSWDGAQWSISQNSSPSAAFAVSSYTSGVLTITHDDLGTTGSNNVALTPRGSVMRPVVSGNSGAAGTGTLKIEFYDVATNSLQTTATTDMKVFIVRGQSGDVNPQTVDTTAFPNSNLWIYGIFEV